MGIEIDGKFSEAWNELSKQCAEDRPSRGKSVLVLHGKHKGKRGKVLIHTPNRFDHHERYQTTAQAWLRDMIGTYGFRIQVEADNGELFWIDADKVHVMKGVKENE